MTCLILLSIIFLILRYLWVFKIPCHGDLGYFVDPRCVQDRRYHFTESMVTYLLGCFRVFSCWFYQTAWIIAGNYKRFKKVKNVMQSAMIIIGGIGLYHVAGLIEVNPTIAFILFLLVNSDFVWGGYVTTADQIVMCFMPAILFYWLSGIWWLAFLLIAIDVFANKPVGVFIYGPLTLYTFYIQLTTNGIQLLKFMEICGPLLIGFLVWNVWLRYNGNTMRQSLRTIAPLNWPRTYSKLHPDSSLLTLIELYGKKFRVLLAQIWWASVIPIFAVAVLFWKVQHPVLYVMLVGVSVNWWWQKGRNWYYVLPALPLLALLAAQSPMLAIVIGLVVWAIQSFLQMENMNLCMHHLTIFAHMYKCELIERLFAKHIEPGRDLTLIGNLTCVWHMTNTICPEPRILGWGSNAFLSLHGRHPDYVGYDDNQWHIPVPNTDYVLAVLVRNPEQLLGVWYVPLITTAQSEATLFVHLKCFPNWEENKQRLLTYFKDGGTIAPVLLWGSQSEG